MLVNLSIKNVPEEIAELLRKRAERNNRSLQGELKTILEETVQSSKLSFEQVEQQLKKSGLETDDDAVEIIRSLRNER